MSVPNLTPEQQAQLASLLNTFAKANEPPKVKTDEEVLDAVVADLEAIERDNLPFDYKVASHLLAAIKALRPKNGTSAPAEGNGQ